MIKHFLIHFWSKALSLKSRINKNLWHLRPKFFRISKSFIRWNESGDVSCGLVKQQKIIPKLIYFNLRSSINEKTQNALQIELFVLKIPFSNINFLQVIFPNFDRNFDQFGSVILGFGLFLHDFNLVQLRISINFSKVVS